MRKIELRKMRSFLAATLMSALFATTAVASSGGLIVTPVEGKQLIRIALEDPLNQRIRLSIQSLNGYSHLYSEEVSSVNGYSKLFDVRNLVDGEYKIVSDNGTKLFEQIIVVNRGRVEVSESKETFLPYFTKKDGQLLVTYLNLDGNDVEISFSDYYTTFFEDKNIDEEISLKRAYDLKKLRSGDYLVKLIAGERTYYYDFTVR
ncbi:MAG: hypothetical protein ACOC3T_03595 [Bacteroidota bacterium]